MVRIVRERTLVSLCAVALLKESAWLDLMSLLGLAFVMKCTVLIDAVCAELARDFATLHLILMCSLT